MALSKFKQVCNLVLCKIGAHAWTQSRPLTPVDGFPPFYMKYKPPIRVCCRCDKKQRWLPGYGGSEWGSWEPGIQMEQDDSVNPEIGEVVKVLIEQGRLCLHSELPKTYLEFYGLLGKAFNLGKEYRDKGGKE